jgi:hypothetical protein
LRTATSLKPNGNRLLVINEISKNLCEVSGRGVGLPKDTLGAIELTRQARELLKKGFARQSQIRPSERIGCDYGFWGGWVGIGLNG